MYTGKEPVIKRLWWLPGKDYNPAFAQYINQGTNGTLLPVLKCGLKKSELCDGSDWEMSWKRHKSTNRYSARKRVASYQRRTICVTRLSRGLSGRGISWQNGTHSTFKGGGWRTKESVACQGFKQSVHLQNTTRFLVRVVGEENLGAESKVCYGDRDGAVRPWAAHLQ